MHFSLDPNDPASVPAAIALQEAKLSHEWADGDPSPPGTALADEAPILCTSLSGAEGKRRVRIDCIALLAMLLPAGLASDSVRAAEHRTFTHQGLGVLRELSAHVPGDPELPMSRRLLALLAALEQEISGPVFVPERFTYVPAETFDGEALGAIDCVFAAVFSVAGRKLPLDKLMTGLPRVGTWRMALEARDSVRKALADAAPQQRRLGKVG